METVAAVVGVTDAVVKLSSAIARFRQDYKLADEDLDVARSHAILLKEEIASLKGRNSRGSSVSLAQDQSLTASERSTQTNHSLSIDEASFNKAISTACDLFSDIDTAFPLRLEPHTWRSKVRWALKDKKVLTRLKERLQSTESTLQGIVSMEQLRISQLIYQLLMMQQPTMQKIQHSEPASDNMFVIAAVNQSGPGSSSAFIQTQPPEFLQEQPQSTQLIVKPLRFGPWAAGSDQCGISAQIVATQKNKGTSYRFAVQVALGDTLYTVRLQLAMRTFSLRPSFQTRNIVPINSEIAKACRAGDFSRARELLARGLARGSDVTTEGWPMLEYAIESRSAPLVRLLIDHGAKPDIVYGEQNMSALQSSFLRGELDIARILLSQGADIEHVDGDGYSALSYLWVNEGPMQRSIDFMRLCMTNEFSEINASDSRGWTPFHRAAAVGTSGDVEAFLRLGAALDSRAAWYGWTPLFFAASHDNLETFETIVKHSRPDVFECLDGDGWNLLHCCVYFRALQVMRLVLRSGIDVNQTTLPAPLPEDPDLSYKLLTARDIAIYMGPESYKLFVDALADTGREAELEGGNDHFWDAGDMKTYMEDNSASDRDRSGGSHTMYGFENFNERWALLHWACYNGSPKVQRLLLLKGPEPEHLDAIMIENMVAQV